MKRREFMSVLGIGSYPLMTGARVLPAEAVPFAAPGDDSGSGGRRSDV